MTELILPQQSYQLVGLLFKTYNELGPVSYKEKHFQKALELKLKQNNIPFESQRKLNLEIIEGKVGNFYIDLIVYEPPNQIILELKRSQYITLEDIRQINRYLEITGIKLGIIVNASRKGQLNFKRIINSKID